MATKKNNASNAASVEEAPAVLDGAKSRENNISLGETEVKFKINFDSKAICILVGAALVCFIGVRVTNKAVGK